ncbi:MAG TPA: thioredoxin family protein, partial [Blastocatellia bacterium]|nr:thioredoxin family protein [Blastocatellia bacterium]
MEILSESDKNKVRKMLDDGLISDVEIVFFTERESPIIIPGKEPCHTCSQTRELLEEVAGLSDKLSLSTYELPASREEAFKYGVSRIPAIIIKGSEKGAVRFFGIPSGYEFSAFIDDLIDASSGATSLSEETR